MEFPVEITLRKTLAAIQIQPAEAGKEHQGIISQLPNGAEVHVCGEGFNTRTVKVAWGGQLYFVFLQDIETPARED